MKTLRHIWNGIRAVLLAIGRVLGNINNLILLSLAFYVLLFPIAWLRRTFKGREDAKGWLPRTPLKRKHYEKQY